MVVLGEVRIITFVKVLVAVGFVPDGEGVGLAHTGVAVGPGGFVTVSDRMRTSVPTIYCIGDLSGPPLLAHKASREGELVAEVIAGRPVVRDWKSMPLAIFTDPEVAQVGLTEAQAVTQGFEVLTGRFAFASLGRAVAIAETDGFVKVIADRESRLLLGVTIVGPAACELIAEAALALELGAVLEDVAHTVHAHPTLPEAFMEACKVALGEAVHALNRR
jgi:dihydrolipoamide dehydrogenase